MKPEELFEKYTKEIASQGIFLNPDYEFTMDLIRGILKNRERYGDDYCPCRLVTGNKAIDRDIVCPCIYRDQDIEDFGQCYCALYVNQEWIDKGSEKQIPDRWNPDEIDTSEEKNKMTEKKVTMPSAVTLNSATAWHCTVCGYIALRPKPPAVCPVCGAKKDRFDKLSLVLMKPES